MLDDPLPIDDIFPDEQLAAINVSNNTPWYADYTNYIVAKYLSPIFTYQQKEKFFYDLRHYFWDDPHLYKEAVDGIIRRCVPEHEHEQILRKFHSEAGSLKRFALKIHLSLVKLFCWKSKASPFGASTLN